MQPTMTKLALALAIGGFVSISARAGDLEPVGPPAPTMATLQQIHGLLQRDCCGVAVAKTGQTSCWNASGSPVACAGTGQDGDYQTGAAVAPRFTDNGDGTVKDNLTALVWLEDANCFGPVPYSAALTSSNTLASGSCGLTDGSVAGDWRLPNIRELLSLVDFQNTFPALPTGHPFSDVPSSELYWVSTSFQGNTRVIQLANGRIQDGGFVDNYRFWPVRDGQ